MPLSEALEDSLTQLAAATPGKPFGRGHPVWQPLERAAILLTESAPMTARPTLKLNWSAGKGVLSSIPFIALLDNRETHNPQSGVYCVYLFRQDASGVYLTFNQGVTQLVQQNGKRRAYDILRARVETLRGFAPHLVASGFSLDGLISLHSESGLARSYEKSTVAFKLYERWAIPNDETLFRDLDAVLRAYDNYLSSGGLDDITDSREVPRSVGRDFDLGSSVEALAEQITARGFVFEPWQIATYVTALRTKPFIILAGVSGTGKSKLPALVAEATGGLHNLVPVRPDWTDSADVLGYTDLQGQFRPGSVLDLADKAIQDPKRLSVCILDEMNLARVEQYFAEILSRIEDRHRTEEGGYASDPLVNHALARGDNHWSSVVFPQNLAIVGTVNMDESTHGFSRKVLDRAFTLELSDTDLGSWRSIGPSESAARVASWPLNAWFPRACRLGELEELTIDEQNQVQKVVTVLIEINEILTPAQLQIGYRTRDEIVMFILNAAQVSSCFVTRAGEAVRPLDLPLQMKILPRIAGGSAAIRRVVLGLLGWAVTGTAGVEEDEANHIITDWDNRGRSPDCPDAQYPRTAARLCLMWERLITEGYTSFWL